jgi:hypothetical protein
MSCELKDKNEFIIDDVKLKEIIEKFQIDKVNFKKIHDAYLDFSLYLKKQYLAHVMRGIECYIREHMNDRRFFVVCEPYNELSPGIKPASSAYYTPKPSNRSEYHCRFVINYDKKLIDEGNEKILRDYISHEIGHLLLRKLKKEPWEHFNTSNAGSFDEKCSSIFGIFTMSEKNYFYDNCKSLVKNHNNWQELFEHFQKITQGVES